MLTFISTEIHRAFKPLWHDGADAEKQEARETAANLFAFTATQMKGPYLFGDALSAADCYLFVMLRWAAHFDIALPEALIALRRRMEQRPSVEAAIDQEEWATARNRTTEVWDNPAQHRFERPIHDQAVAAAYYRVEDGQLVFIHVEVPSEFSGQGIATALAQGTFDLLRKTGRKAVLRCPFMNHFFAAHPDYADIVVG
jgi:hypothetical protein